MRTVFIRAIEAAVDDKAAAILSAANGSVPTRFVLDSATFSQVPRSPFAYWVSDRLRQLFTVHPSVTQIGVQTAIGASTKNDFRYLRLVSEVQRRGSGRSLSQTGPESLSADFAVNTLAGCGRSTV